MTAGNPETSLVKEKIRIKDLPKGLRYSMYCAIAASILGSGAILWGFGYAIIDSELNSKNYQELSNLRKQKTSLVRKID